MVRHHTESNDIDPKLPGQKFQPSLNPLFAVIVIVSADGIFPAEVRSPDTSIDTMVDTNSTFVDRVATGQASHEGTFGLSFPSTYPSPLTPKTTHTHTYTYVLLHEAADASPPLHSLGGPFLSLGGPFLFFGWPLPLPFLWGRPCLFLPLSITQE